MKKFLLIASCLLLSLANNRALAAIDYWDPEGVSSIGYTGSLSQTWENSVWSTSGTGSATGAAFVANDAACFAVGTDGATPAFTVTMNSPHTIGGFFNGGADVTPDPCTATVSGTGTITLASANLNACWISSNASDPGVLTVNNVIAGASTAGFCAEGSGSLVLNGANTYSGGTFLGFSGEDFTGVWNLGSSSCLGAGGIFLSNCYGDLAVVGNSALTIPNGITNVMPVSFNAFTTLDIFGNAAGLTFSGSVVLSGGTTSPQGNITTALAQVGLGSDGGAGNLVILSGVVSGTNNLVKFGTGVLELTGVNTASGTLTVSNGTFTVGGSGSLGSGTYASKVTNNATFAYSSSAKQTMSGVISGTGGIVVNGPGTLVLSGNANSYSNVSGPAITINGGIFQTGGDQTTGNTAANLGITPNSLQANNIVLHGGTLQGNNANFAFMPNRGITLTANSGLSSTTSGNDLIPLQGELGIQGPITDNSAGYGITITGQTNLTTGQVSGVYLEGTNTYTGFTIVQSGILSLYNNGSINNSSSISINSGAVFDVSSNNTSPWNLNQTLYANGSGLGLPGYLTLAPSPAAVFIGASGGSINFGSHTLGLTIAPTNFTGDASQPALYISQGNLQLNGNSLTLTNSTITPLGYGTYTLIQLAPGYSISGTVPTLSGSVGGGSIVAGAAATLVINGGALNLVVAPPAGASTAAFNNMVLSPSTFVYNTMPSSVTVSGTVSNTSGQVAQTGDTVTVSIGSIATGTTTTFDASGDFTVTVPLTGSTPAGFIPVGNYAVSCTFTGTVSGLTAQADTSETLLITPAQLIETVNAQNKNYNGTTAVTYTLSSNAMSDVVNVALQSAPATGSAAFATPNVGNNILVTVGWLYITGGANAGNWYLPSEYTVTTTASILSPNHIWDGLDYVTNSIANWSDAFDWESNSAPDLVGDSLIFAGATGEAPVMQTPYTNWSVTFASGAGPFTLTNTGGATAMSLGAGGISNLSSATQTINLPISNLSTLSSLWDVIGGSTLILNSNLTDAGGGITLSGGGVVEFLGSNYAVTGPLTNLSGTIQFGNGSSPGTKLNNESYAGAISNNGTFTWNSISNQTLSGNISGSGAFTLNSVATFTLSGSNGYSGITTVNAGSLQISNDFNLGAAPGSPVANQLYMNCGLNGVLDYGLRCQSDSFTLNANRGIYLGPTGGSINVQSGDSVTVAGVISGPGSFYACPNYSSGYGTIIIDGLNTYTGPTIIGAGTLTMGASGVLPYGTALTVGSSDQGAGDGSFFNMATFSQTIGTLQSSTGIGGSAGTGTPTIENIGALTILQTNINTTFAGVISGTGSVTLTVPAGGTASELTLTGTNTYTGATTISQGATLGLGSKGAISNSANIFIAAGGTLDVSALSTNFLLSASTTLNARGTGTTVGSTAATINGAAALTNNLEARPINLTYTPASFVGDSSHPALYVSQGKLALNGNAFTVNNASGTPLNPGTYVLIQVASGTIISSGTYTVSVTGSGLTSGATAAIQVSGGNVNLVVKEPAALSNLTPSQSVPYGTNVVTLGGTISGNGPVYAALGETVTVTINGIAQSTTINDSTGDFSINYNPSAIPASATPYAISYGYTGDALLIGVTNTGTTLTVVPANQTITFSAIASQTYGAAPFVVSASASSGLTVSLAVVSGPATLASSTLTLTGAGSVSIAASQSGNANYNAATSVTNTFTVNPLAVDLAGARFYDGTNDATNTILSITNSVGSDNVNVGSGSATLASADIGTNAIVSVTNLALGGTAATNYTLTAASGAVIVNPLPVALTGTRAYDGTNDADASILSFETNYDGVNLTLSGSATLAGSTAGPESITVFSNLTLGGTAATNYTLTNAAGSVTVTSLPLTITANSEIKTYGTLYSLDPTAFTVIGTLFGSETPTAVTMTAIGGTGVTDPVSGSPYTITPSAATGTGGFLATNYNISYVAGTLTVSPLPVGLTGTRPYDGMNDAAFGILSITNVVGGDDVSLAAGSAVLAGLAVGTQAITSPGTLALGGVTAPNYTLTGVSGSVTITSEALTITANPQSKTYGTTLALGTSAFTVGSGLASGEIVTAVTLTVSGGTTSNAPVSGSPYTITPSAAVGTGGFVAANYNIAYITNSLTVSALPVVLNGTRNYDGTTNAALAILAISNAVGGDDVGLTNGPAGLASADIGTNAVTSLGTLALTGATAGNYSLASPIGAVIVTPLPIVLTGTRPYDGTNDAAFGILSISNAVAGDDVSLASGSAVLAGAAAGPEAVSSAGTLALAGTTASNYSLTSASGLVAVTTVPLTITANAQSKTYGAALSLGTTAFTVGSGLVGSETVTAAVLTASGGTGATDPVSGSPYTITPSDATGINGFLAANYDITYDTNSLTVSPLAVVLTGTRPYDGTGGALFSILSVSNVIGSDDVNAASGSGVLASASVGVEPITSAGTLALGGSTAPNYTLTGLGGAVVVTNPNTVTNNTLQITSATSDGHGNLVVVWQTVPGVSYSILTNSSLGHGAWVDIGTPLSPTGPVPTNTYSVSIPGITNAQGFVLIKQN